MGTITEILQTGRVLVSDGAWGTYLYEKGLRPGECPDAWSLERPDDVYEIARSYIDAGSDLVETNSFGASRFKLEHFGLADKTAQINEAAARASRKAAGDRLVLGSMGPTGRMLLMGDVTEQELYDAFYEQAGALYRGGADALCIETMMDPQEAGIAIRAAKAAAPLEVAATFTFELTKNGDYRTMMGTTPGQAAHAALEAGADIIGANCGNGMERMADIVQVLRTALPGAYILVHANAGLPENIDGKDVYQETPDVMAGFLGRLLDNGVNIVGGCCGTTPAHIKKIKEIVQKKNGEK